MQRKVWRYSLKKRETILEIPGLIDILEIGYKTTNEEPNLWVEILSPEEGEEEVDSIKLSFLQITTGEIVPEEYYHLKTLESKEGPGFIYHVYCKEIE